MTKMAGSERRSMKRKQPEPEVIRFTHTVEMPVPGFTICNLSEQDVRDLHHGVVPDWIIQTADMFLATCANPSAKCVA